MDKQTRLVYGWEDKWRCFAFKEWNGLYEPRKRIAWACRKYGVPTPVVRWAPRNTFPFYVPEDHAIYISRHTNNPLMALHEAAHAIVDWLVGDSGEHHSAEFVGVYVWLLERYQLAPGRAITVELDRMGVKRVPGSPRALKARYRKRIRAAVEVRAEDRLASRSTRTRRR